MLMAEWVVSGRRRVLRIRCGLRILLDVVMERWLLRVGRVEGVTGRRLLMVIRRLWKGVRLGMLLRIGVVRVLIVRVLIRRRVMEILWRGKLLRLLIRIWLRER